MTEKLIDYSLLPECNISQCGKLFSSKWKLLNTSLTVLLPLSISALSYIVAKPLVEGSEDIDECDKKGDLERATNSFNILCILASGMSLVIMGIMEVVDYFMLKTGDVTQMAQAHVRANQYASIFKACVYVALIVSAFVAYGTYQTCKRKASEKGKDSAKKN